MVTSSEIMDLSSNLGKDGQRSIDYLQRHGFITRVLRGIFYVRSPEEREIGRTDKTIYELISMALLIKGETDWYFGLETALKMDRMTHEYFSINYVICRSFRTTKPIRVQNSTFMFLRWSEFHFGFGIIRKGELRFSDPEKTVLDMVYRRYQNGSDRDYILDPLIEYSDRMGVDRLKEYLDHYSKRFQDVVSSAI